MFKENCGKLMVYASTGVPIRKRLDSVRTAAKETAKRLNLDFEMVKLDRGMLHRFMFTMKKMMEMNLFRYIVMKEKCQIWKK